MWESLRFDDDMTAHLPPLTARHNADKSLADDDGLRYTSLGDRVAYDCSLKIISSGSII